MTESQPLSEQPRQSLPIVTGASYWHGKRAVITGGSAGLGRALSEALVTRGTRVALAARNHQTLEQTATTLRQLGGDVLPVAADVTKAAEVERLAQAVADHFGKVDLFCHCAGRSMRGDVLTTSIDDFQALWEVNALAAVRGVQAMEPLLTDKGHVVLIGSLASKLAPRYLGAYPTTKFPLAALAQQLRLELGPSGKHVLLVCPGPIARPDANRRYAGESVELPDVAKLPAGGAKLRGIDPSRLAHQILRACERRQAELIVPRKARLLCLISQISPRLGDWILRKTTSG